MSNKNKSINGILQNLALVSQIGLIMVIPIIAGVFVGGWIDKALGTKVVFLIIFVILGVGSAFRNVYTIFKQKIKEYENVESPSTYVKKFEKTLKSSKEASSKDEVKK